MANRNTVKAWFLSLKKPNQSQFHQWLDSIWFKDEKLAISDVQDLEQRLNSLSLYNITYIAEDDVIYADIIGRTVLEKVVLMAADVCSATLKTEAGDDIYEGEIELEAGVPVVIRLDYVSIGNVKAVIEGMHTGSTAVFFFRNF